MTDNLFWRSTALPYAESRRSGNSSACYKTHSHPTLSLGSVDAGHSLFTSSHCRQELQAGDLILIPPHCAHACNPLPGAPWSYQMLYLESAWLQQTMYRCHLDASPMFQVPILIRSPALYRQFCRTNALLFSAVPDTDKQQALLHFLTRQLPEAPVQPLCTSAGPLHPAVAQSLELLQKNVWQKLPLPQLADMIGVSRHHLIRLLHQQTGLTPHAWQLDMRINLARRQLRLGQTVSSLACDLGFTDQSHFHRTFLERVAATPGHYRQAGRGTR